MDYELAKQLKDAGFPQKINVCGAKFYFDDNGDEVETWDRHSWEEINNTAGTYIPTLSELIEACGDKFWELELYIDGRWDATGKHSTLNNEWIYNEYSSKGSTPEEAVAKLWLELKKK